MRRAFRLVPFLTLVLIAPAGLIAQERSARRAPLEWPADAFADAGARDLVLRALALRDSAAAGLESYEATATERMHVGMEVTRRLPLRSRTLYHREQVARVYWQQDGDHRVQWLGRREGTPTMGDDWSDRAPFGLDFDLAEELDLEEMGIDVLFDPLGDRMDVFDAEFVQPVSSGGLQMYRFALGDTMQIRLPPPARPITLIEVIVRPRVTDWEAVEGSLWFDRDTGILARGAYRPSGVWDMEVREPGDLDDVPGFLKPAVGTVTSIVIEYGLYEQRWWLPSRVVGEGVFDWGHGLVRMPLVMELTMTGHTVNEAPSANVTAGQDLELVSWDRSSGNGRFDRTRYFVRRGVDLSKSPELPAPIGDVEMLAFTQAELKPLIARIEQVAGAPPRGRAQSLETSLLHSLRYDRVRGPSVGLEWAGDAARFQFAANARFASAVPELFGEIAATRGAFTATLYHRLDDASDWNVGDGLGNTAALLLFGHDGGDYYRSTGFSLGRRGGGERARLGIELFYEHQHSIARQTSISLATIGGGSLRSNVDADPITLGGARAEITGQLGSDVQKAVFNWRLWAEGGGGDAEYGRVAATTRLTGTLDRVALALEVAAGLAGNGAPIQRSFYLGGVATLRGVNENAVTGPAFWLARAEAGTALPGMRAALFTDMGWAGARDAVGQSRPTVGAGIGASIMDGLFRVDVARGVVRSAAWRIYFYLDALL